MNVFEKRSMAAYNKKAANYDDTFDGKLTLKFKHMLLDTVNIQNGDAVLDIACGNGKLLHMFADRYAIEGYGADISDKMVEQAKLMNPAMTFSVDSCEKLPYADGTFDIVTVCAAYHHFPNVNIFAQEAYRLLKSNGKIYIADILFPAIIRPICNLFVQLSPMGDVKFYSPREIMNTLNSVGFQNGGYIKKGQVQIVNASRP